MTYQEALDAATHNIVVRFCGEFALTQHLETNEYGFVPYCNGGDLASLLGILDLEWVRIEEWYWDEQRMVWRVVQQT